MNPVEATPAETSRRRRATVRWVLVALVGLAFLVGPAFTHRDLTPPHVVAHLVTGPTILLLAVFQIAVARKNRSRRSLDVVLALSGSWLGALPFVIPAPGLHVHAHAVAGALVFIGMLANIVRPPHARSSNPHHTKEIECSQHGA